AREKSDMEEMTILIQDEEGTLIQQRNTQPARLPWIISTIVLLFLTAALIVRDILPASSQSSFETGFDTDFEPALPAISMHQVRFSGALRADENGTLFPAFNSSEPRYVGPPSPEIDQTWEKLLGRRYLYTTDEEAATVEGPLYKFQHGGKLGTFVGVDMLHSLHCLNALRQKLDPDYYQHHMDWLPVEYRRMHMDHCVDQIRQAILCAGDLTPVTLQPILTGESRILILGQAERLHTCRNGMAIRDWFEERGDRLGAF
ncbi:hypothetical protein V498_07859, partial [Pseudogymnoascus sp. VKM F-4517 (FW-2822)]